MIATHHRYEVDEDTPEVPTEIAEKYCGRGDRTYRVATAQFPRTDERAYRFPTRRPVQLMIGGAVVEFDLLLESHVVAEMPGVILVDADTVALGFLDLRHRAPVLNVTVEDQEDAERFYLFTQEGR
jgi:hypothetical protein